MQNNPVSWFEIYVEDMDRAKSFYETVLGVELSDMSNPETPDMAMMSFPWTDDAPGAAGALVKSSLTSPSSKGSIVYFDTKDCDASLALVEQAGGSVIMPKAQAGEWGFFCLFSDTEGNTVGFFSNK